MNTARTSEFEERREGSENCYFSHALSLQNCTSYMVSVYSRFHKRSSQRGFTVISIKLLNLFEWCNLTFRSRPQLNYSQDFHLFSTATCSGAGFKVLVIIPNTEAYNSKILKYIIRNNRQNYIEGCLREERKANCNLP